MHWLEEGTAFHTYTEEKTLICDNWEAISDLPVKFLVDCDGAADVVV